MNKHIVQLLVIVQESNNPLGIQEIKKVTTELKILSQGSAENQLQIKLTLPSIKNMVILMV